MLTPKETKLVLSTLTQRRAFLVKSMSKPGLTDAAKEELLTTTKILDASLQKISKLTAPQKETTDSLPTKKPPSAPPPPKKVKRAPIALADAYVLIAEDNADSALLLKSVLEDMGIKKIDVVEDGRAAVRALENCSPPYDAVLCDWDMPEMNGLEVRKAIKPLAKLRDMHFMMVTASSESTRIREAIMNGVNDYIIKPVDLNILETKLRAALEGGGGPQEKEDLIAVKK